MSKIIKRERYLKSIRPFYEQDLIKVITGIRRSGKSVLLSQIMDEIREKKIPEERIIYINFEYEDYDFIKNHLDLNKYVVDKMQGKERYYLFFDEIQNVDGWERVVNSLKASRNVSIFLTGSNSDLLSGELATHIAGRYVSFRIYPFTFSEVCELLQVKGNKINAELEDTFQDYMMWGGMPQRFMMDNEAQVRTYLNDIYNSILLKDIVARFNIKDLDLCNRIMEFIMSTPSQNFSADALTNYFLGADKREVSRTTLYNYLEYMSRAMMINKADRYDVRGKRILSGKYKYYLTDLGLGRVLSTDKKPQNGVYLENIVYNELLARGYVVKVGDLPNAEIDFVATRFDEKVYIQVAYILADDSVVQREFGAFDGITDNYQKLVLSLDKFNFSHNGIMHKNVLEWLLEEEE